MNLKATPPGGTRMDITEFYRSVTWTGSIRTCGRQLQMDLFNPQDGDFERPNIPSGSAVELWEDETLLFYGQALIHKQPRGSSILSVTALDNARFLARNDGWYIFRSTTPEAATAQICRDFGIPVGELAATGVKITRKFAGVSIHKIIATLYTMAGEQTGKRYIVRFVGGKLTVKVKSEGLPDLVIAPGANLMDQTTTVDASNIYTRAAIYSKSGKLIRTIDSPDTRNAYGTFQKIITQRKGVDAVKEAQAILDDNGVKQTITVDVTGNAGLVTGETVALVDAFSGRAGRFWIDADTHVWKNHQHFTKLNLNFKSMMDEQSAGSVK